MLKVGDVYIQVAPIEEYRFNYVGREFTIKSITDKAVMFTCEGLGYGAIETEYFGKYFMNAEEIKAKLNYKRVIRNGKATIVILADGSKGVAKCSPDDEYDADKGLEIATLRAEI
jgi:hypothetical protein